MPVPDDLPFPHVSEVFLIERYVTGLHGQPISAVAALGVASPKPEQADAADLARGSEVAPLEQAAMPGRTILCWWLTLTCWLARVRARPVRSAGAVFRTAG